MRSVGLQLIPYHRGMHPVTGKTMPFHWAIFAATGPGPIGDVYQLRGMPGAFHYDGPERRINPGNSQRKRQELDIGAIPSDKIKDMEDLIQKVPVSTAEQDHNCQTWAEDALKAMESKGWLYMTASQAAQWLKSQET